MRRTLGSLLHSADKERVLETYVYRMTHESIKRWPDTVKQSRGYSLSIISDEQWLSSTTFAVRKDGRLPLSNRNSACAHDAYKFRTVVKS